MSTTPQSSERQHASIFPTAVKYGVIAGLVGIIVSVIFFLLDMSTSSIDDYIGLVVLFITLILAMRAYRDEVAGGYMRYGQGVSLGILTSLICSILAIVWFMVFINFLEVDLLEQMLLNTEQQMIDEGYSDDMVEQAMVVSRKITTPLGMSISVLTFYVLAGLVFSLFIAAFTKRK